MDPAPLMQGQAPPLGEERRWAGPEKQRMKEGAMFESEETARNVRRGRDHGLGLGLRQRKKKPRIAADG